MTCVVKYYLYFRINLYKLVIKYRFYQGKSCFCVFYGIKRLYRRFSFSGIFTALSFCVFFMYVCAVSQHYFQQICCCICTVNLSSESPLCKQRKSAAMIYMRMTQDYAFYFFRCKRKSFSVHGLHRFSTLKLSAIK